MPLGKKADAGDYVKDFYKSKAPQFKGKSKNKRRQMAIAAYLDARDKGKAKSEDMTFKVEVDGLPAMYIDGNSPGQVKNHLRKLIKQPSMIKGVSRMTKHDVKKTYRAKAQGKEVDEEDMTGYLKSMDSKKNEPTPVQSYLALKKKMKDKKLKERYDYPHGTAKAYKAATPGQEKGDGYTKEAARIPRKKGQPANSKKHSDLYTDENPKGTIHGLKFASVADAKASVAKIKKSSRKHAHKIQAAIAMEQRARVAGKNAEAAVYRKYINAMKKKTKSMQNEAIKYTHVAVDKKGKVAGMASKASDAKDMARRHGGTHHQLKKPMHPKVGDMMINRPFNPVLKKENAMDMVKANNAQSKKGYKTEKLSIPKIRNIMYKGAKALGDVQAVRKKKVGKRVARRTAGKLASRALRSLIKNDVQEGKGGKPESFEKQFKRRVVKTTKPEHKEKGYNWRIKGKDRPGISIKLYKSKPGQAEFNKQLRRVAGHEFGG